MDAAGYGWSGDISSATAAGRVDLLSVVTHELGHVLGYDHDDPFDVMGATLSLGVRRLPTSSNPMIEQVQRALVYITRLTDNNRSLRSG